MRTTGFFFQLARGRAMVRNRHMRRARTLKAKLAQTTDRHDRQYLTYEISYMVRCARQAHRQWLDYRAAHAEQLATDAAYDAKFKAIETARVSAFKRV